MYSDISHAASPSPTNSGSIAAAETLLPPEDEPSSEQLLPHGELSPPVVVRVAQLLVLPVPEVELIPKPSAQDVEPLLELLPIPPQAELPAQLLPEVVPDAQLLVLPVPEVELIPKPSAQDVEPLLELLPIPPQAELLSELLPPLVEPVAQLHESSLPEAELLSPEVGCSGSPNSPDISNINPERRFHSLIAGSYVSVSYGSKWYPGVIEKLCGDEVDVNFMQIKGVNKFAWPARQDRLLVPWCDILCGVSPLMCNKRFHEMSKVDYENSVSAFEKWSEDD